MAQRKGISIGTTAQRTIEEQGKIRFNTTLSLLEYYDGTNWKVIDAPPVVSSIDVTDVASDGGGDQTFVITGSGFSATITEVRFVATSGSDVVAGSVTRDSATQLTVTATKSSFANAGEPYAVKVTNNSGLAGTLAGQVNVDSAPVWQTASGSLGSIFDGNRGTASFTVAAHDAESDAITYTLQSGSLPAGSTLSSQSSGAVISGFDAVGSATTSTFTLRATANSKTSDRQYTITVNPPVITSFTASGTLTVPSGLTSVNVLVVAGGGGGGADNGGGGGAGGLIYRPGFPISPGTPISVTVGDGAATPGQDNYTVDIRGQDSVFGTLTAKGGGGGGTQSTTAGQPGGSGGGGNGHNNTGKTAGSATQPTQPGDSGNYGFGNNGGAGYAPGQMYGGGGGGAGGAGSPNDGGSSKSYSISGTSVAYAGGGGGGTNGLGNGNPGGGGAGSGGSPGTAASANRGSGGGGGNNSNPRPGGNGGKGIVIVSY